MLMSYECRYLRGTYCNKRAKECDPGEPGCVLRGRFVFGLKEQLEKKSTRASMIDKKSSDGIEESPSKPSKTFET